PQIVAFAGSNRRGSLNRQALSLAVAGAQAAGAEVVTLDLRDFPMPIYDADWHQANGVPESVRLMRRVMIKAQGLLIASPEYNASITPLLKNTIDWLSQDVDGESGTLPFHNKAVGLMGASNGAFGTIRSLPHVSYILSNLGAIVLPVLAVPQASSLFNSDGGIQDTRKAQQLQTLGSNVARFAHLGSG
ncbi:MAG: NAD(P)H-dependent oxidoreductase, partial [Betaproteobacteria bacterium]|nr:NAD(P)H-dependent oxidoreductase [Betaproteobacteria bacterium]